MAEIFDTQTFNIHGIGVRVSAAEPRAAQAIASFLRYYRAPGLAMTAPEISVDLDSVEGSAVRRYAPDPLFVYDVVRGYRNGFGIRLTDGFSDIDVGDRASRITGTIGAKTLVDPYLFSVLFFNIALQHCLRQHGLFYLHAAAAVVDGYVALFVGNSGSGKTTLTATLGLGGSPIISDDAVFIRDAQSCVEILAFRRPLHFDRAMLEAFDTLQVHADGPWPRVRGDRWDVDPYRAFAGRVVDEAVRPSQLVDLSYDPSLVGLTLKPVRRHAALSHLLPQSALVILGGQSTSPHLDGLSGVVRACDCWELTRGPSGDRDHEVLAERLANGFRGAGV